MRGQPRGKALPLCKAVLGHASAIAWDKHCKWISKGTSTGCTPDAARHSPVRGMWVLVINVNVAQQLRKYLQAKRKRWWQGHSRKGSKLKGQRGQGPGPSALQGAEATSKSRLNPGHIITLKTKVLTRWHHKPTIRWAVDDQVV